MGRVRTRHALATNIASLWDASPSLHRFYKHGVPTGRWTPPITRSVNSKSLTSNGVGHRITPDVNRQNFRSARNEDPQPTGPKGTNCRSEEHTSELQSRENLVCRLLL